MRCFDDTDRFTDRNAALFVRVVSRVHLFMSSSKSTSLLLSSYHGHLSPRLPIMFESALSIGRASFTSFTSNASERLYPLDRLLSWVSSLAATEPSSTEYKNVRWCALAITHGLRPSEL